MTGNLRNVDAKRSSNLDRDHDRDRHVCKRLQNLLFFSLYLYNVLIVLGNMGDSWGAAFIEQERKEGGPVESLAAQV